MEALLVIAVLIFIAVPVVTLVILSSLKNNNEKRLTQISEQLDFIGRQLKDLSERGLDIKVEHAKPVAKPEVVIETPKPPVIVPPKVELPPIVKPQPEPELEPQLILPEIKSEPVLIFDEPKPSVAQMPAPRKPGFFERNPDLEKFIGENLANKIGIGVLVIGIGFFVKYAIDQEWINEIGRVFIGLTCGGILLGLAHRLRKQFTEYCWDLPTGYASSSLPLARCWWAEASPYCILP